MRRILFPLIVVSLAAALADPAFSQDESSAVKMWVTEERLPTYPIGDPDRNPVFYNGRVYQGAQGRVYPFPLLDKLSNSPEERAHTVVYLENEFVKLGVMPGPAGGGRIFLAEDKTNDYDFFYRQTSLKPGLIGVLGAWWSGGVEWNFPHHHRTSNFLPLDYTLEEHEDGSKTVWVGEIEGRHRMKWMVGLTLHPGKSHVELTGKIYNRTPITQSFLFWSNVAVHVDETYQFIFPPSQQWTTGHGKHVFSRWPLATGEDFLNRSGYRAGEDLSYWKAHDPPISIFSIFSQEDFFAGYNHGKDAGVVHVANHHLVPGKKMWSWGRDESAQMWDKILSDEDGPYIELMVGAFQDNQPDYSWLQPYEVKEWTQTWYPIRELGGVKNANLDAAVNLEVEGSEARFGFNSTSEVPNATVLLKVDEEKVFEKQVSISPARPFVTTVDLPAGTAAERVTALLFDEEGRELVRFSPQPLAEEPKPDEVVPPLPPEKIESIEKLYLTGLRLEQFNSAALDPEPYWEEALRRDPGDYRTNTALGIRFLEQGKFSEAEARLQAAIDRVADQQTLPRDGEAYYYLGVVLRFLNREEDAYDALYRATWSSAWHTAAYYQLAEIEAGRGNLAQATAHLDRALSTNQHHLKALNLKATILRRQGDRKAAGRVLAGILDWDPINHRAHYENAMLGTSSTGARQFESLMRGAYSNYLELALDYYGNGFYSEGLEVLDRLLELPPQTTNPVVSTGASLTDASKAMAHYYRGILLDASGKRSEAEAAFARGAEEPTDLVFPSRLEAFEALERALQYRPEDAKTHYYLGNLKFEAQPEKAIRHWEEARRLDPSLAIVHRNLGIGYYRIQDRVEAATESLEKAVELRPSDPRLHLELDQMYDASGKSPEERLTRLEAHADVAGRNDTLVMRQASLYVQTGRFDRAIQLLDGRDFHVWEGGGEIHDVFVAAHLGKGIRLRQGGEVEAALREFRRASDYPRNLGVGRPSRGGRGREVQFFIGTALEELGRKEEARKAFEESAADVRSPSSPLTAFQAMSLQRLGRGAEARDLLESIGKYAREELEAGLDEDFFAKFGEQLTEEERLAQLHYLLGLAHQGLGDLEAARKEFQETLDLDVNHLGARRQLLFLEDR